MKSTFRSLTSPNMRVRILAFVAVAFLTTACLDTLSPSDKRFGFINAAALDDGASGYTMLPEAAFYDKTDLFYEVPVADSCVRAGFNTTGTGFSGVESMDAGAFLTSRVSGRTDTLRSSLVFGIRTYQSSSPLGIPFVPGDTLRIEIPGAAGGFPAAVVSTRTAEPFTHNEVLVPAVGDSLTLTWTPAPAPGSVMTFSLRYANAQSSTVENEQLFCGFVDDGSAKLPPEFIAGWIEATNGNRSTRAVRVRSTELVINSKSRVALVSTFGVPLGALRQ